jgi:hypothetical protein
VQVKFKKRALEISTQRIHSEKLLSEGNGRTLETETADIFQMRLPMSLLPTVQWFNIAVRHVGQAPQNHGGYEKT